ncbi:MAG TPA: copper amine oxidase N-terminal domain-containing protein [Syntrophothermus lipocalidus]|nr:copper amine oxidase N-terminal domain-containing protein [Syntrophothermus lipocalidus]
MRKARNSKLALLLVLTMLATLFVAIPTASAAATYSAGTLMKVSAGDDQNLGSVKVSVPASELTGSPYLIMKLPADFKFNTTSGPLQTVTGETYFSVAGDLDVRFRIPTVKNAAYDNTTGSGYAGITVGVLSDNEIKITINASSFIKNNDEENAYFYVDLYNCYVASGYSGDVTVNIEGSDGSPFVNGSVVVATVGAGRVTLSVDSVKTITTSVYQVDAIRLREDRAGAFKENDTIKLKLPNGFKWKGTVSNYTYSNISGNGTFAFSFDDNDRSLVITSKSTSTSATYTKIIPYGITVDDETVAKLGDVTVTVSGTASVTPDSFVIAKYGEYSARAYAVGDPTTVLAGRYPTADDNYIKIGKFAIEEGIKGSLIDQRTITLQLVGGGARWVKSGSYVAGMSYETTECKGDYTNIRSNWEVIGASEDIARVKVNGTSGDAIKAVFKNAQITVPADYTGDIKLIVGGTAGVSGEFVVAKAVAPVTATVEGNVPNVVIGQGGQQIPDIIVTENMKEAIVAKSAYNSLRLEFPNGVLPTKPTKVEVLAGDLTIDPTSVSLSMSSSNLRWGIDVTVKSTGTTPAKIKFSGIKITTDRTVPEGELKVAVKGSSVVQNSHIYTGRTTAASAVVANCVTPAPGVTKGNAVFTLGQASYVLNGSTVTMPVAPYAKNGRTYLPLRFCGNAIGIDNTNIWWDQATKTATLKKDNTIVQVKLGSQALYVNGVQVSTMDVAPEAKDGYTMLPIRPVLEAFGAKVTYDAATQAISIEY